VRQVRDANLQQLLKFTFQQSTALHTAQTMGQMAPNEVHIYYGAVDPEATIDPALVEVLSDDEKLRASRFHFEKNRNEYVVTRSTLRKLLGSYLSIPPDKLRFLYTKHGKPYIFETPVEIAFNVSHTHGMAALAFTMAPAIGVDVEAVRTNFRADEIGERFFSEYERKILREYSKQERHAAFFRCWTRKEAYIKARGEGLSHPLAQFDVSLDPESDDALIATRPDSQEIKRWLLRSFPVNEGFQAALAVALDLP
jgi:4'-phosphopantetheinyl transferase